MIQTVRTLLISITATKAVMILLIITLVMPTALQNLTIIPEAIMQRTPAASTSPTAWVVPINTAQTLHTSIIAAMIAMILLIIIPVILIAISKSIIIQELITRIIIKSNHANAERKNLSSAERASIAFGWSPAKPATAFRISFAGNPHPL